MTQFDKDFSGEAHLEYGDADFLIMKPGAYVTCAVTGARVALNDLRYWSAEHQEAYADADAATARWLQLNGGPAGALTRRRDHDCSTGLHPHGRQPGGRSPHHVRR